MARAPGDQALSQKPSIKILGCVLLLAGCAHESDTLDRPLRPLCRCGRSYRGPPEDQLNHPVEFDPLPERPRRVQESACRLERYSLRARHSLPLWRERSQGIARRYRKNPLGRRAAQPLHQNAFEPRPNPAPPASELPQALLFQMHPIAPATTRRAE